MVIETEWGVLVAAISGYPAGGTCLLLPDVMAVEMPSTGVFVKTFTTGFRADLITASMALLVVSVLAGMAGTLWWAWARW